jgi:hypothetical protein
MSYATMSWRNWCGARDIVVHGRQAASLIVTRVPKRHTPAELVSPA